MDSELLVDAGQQLVRLLDGTAVKPRAALWVHYADTHTWQLWIVPEDDSIDKRAFYAIVAEVISEHRESLHGLDVSSTKLIPSNHPAMIGMKDLLHMPDIGSAQMAGNMFNGFFLPEGIALRVNL